MILAFLAAAAAQASPPPLARTCSIPIADGARIEEVLSCDFSGDDIADVCIATRAAKVPGAKSSPRARLAIHVRRGPAGQSSGPAFSSSPDATLELPSDVIAFAACDLLPDEGREVLLFNASGVFVWRWRETEESKRVARLFDTDLLWQLPAGGTLFHLQDGVVDLDGDGREDLVVPEPNGARVLFQQAVGRTPRFGPPTRIVIPEESFEGRGAESRKVTLRSPNGRRRLSIDMGEDFDLRGEDAPSGPYLSIDDDAPPVAPLDWDGDGDLDLLTLSDATMHVEIQEPRGTFDAARALHLPSPVPRDRKRELDVSFQVRALDLDLDARADVIYFAQDQRADSARTQALVFRQARAPAGEVPLFGKEGKPSELLVLDGFARPLTIEDVDGDGLPDLVAAALRPNLIDALRAAASERIDTELYVFRNRGAQGFSKRPDLTRVLSLQASGGDGSGTSSPFLADFAGDVTGDGVRDFFVRTDRDRLRVHMVRRGKDGSLNVVDPPLWELAIDPKSRVLMPGIVRERTPDVFVLEPGGLLCASFR
ncbi:MAG: FG-GAP-like repeat-containing protein [Planctomycetota bacterium]|nr:FG-GAP-like repeat-containing protein [Planctomycetota bacterium]